MKPINDSMGKGKQSISMRRQVGETAAAAWWCYNTNTAWRQRRRKLSEMKYTKGSRGWQGD